MPFTTVQWEGRHIEATPLSERLARLSCQRQAPADSAAVDSMVSARVGEGLIASCVGVAPPDNRVCSQCSWLHTAFDAPRGCIVVPEANEMRGACARCWSRGVKEQCSFFGTLFTTSRVSPANSCGYQLPLSPNALSASQQPTQSVTKQPIPHPGKDHSILVTTK